jgi:hypothetical protein
MARSNGDYLSSHSTHLRADGFMGKESRVKWREISYYKGDVRNLAKALLQLRKRFASSLDVSSAPTMNSG